MMKRTQYAVGLILTSLICILGSLASAAPFNSSEYTETIDQHTASPEHLDAVALRAVLALAQNGSRLSPLASTLQLSQDDRDVLVTYELKRREIIIAGQSELCTELPDDPTHQQIVSFGERMNESSQNEETAFANLYRELLAHLSDTGAAKVQDYINNQVIPTVKTRRLDYARLFAVAPGAFRANVLAACIQPTAQGEQQ